jgi:sulfur carrier protein
VVERSNRGANRSKLMQQSTAINKMNETVNAWINGEQRELPADLNVATLLHHLGIVSTRVAVERNSDILPRSQWEQTAVADGDRYEIVHLVGGG